MEQNITTIEMQDLIYDGNIVKFKEKLPRFLAQSPLKNHIEIMEYAARLINFEICSLLIDYGVPFTEKAQSNFAACNLPYSTPLSPSKQYCPIFNTAGNLEGATKQVNTWRDELITQHNNHSETSVLICKR